MNTFNHNMARLSLDDQQYKKLKDELNQMVPREEISKVARAATDGLSLEWMDSMNYIFLWLENHRGLSKNNLNILIDSLQKYDKCYDLIKNYS